MHIRPFRATCPKLEFINSTDSFFNSVKEEYLTYQQSGLFSRREAAAIFVYQIRSRQRQYTGIIACADIEDYLYGRILKHEHTLADQEQKQLQLLMHWQAAVKPVLVTYAAVPAIDDWVEEQIAGREPFLQVYFEQEQQVHALWEVAQAERIQDIRALFADRIRHAYIADGHHRTTSTALLYERTNAPGQRNPYTNLLCAFFPATDLDIHDFNRIVEGSADLSPSLFMARLAQLFHIEILKGPRRPGNKFEVLMFVNQEWYYLRWKPEVLAAYGHEPVVLDSHLLNELVLRDILGIEDVRTDRRVEYVEGPLGLEAVWRRAAEQDFRVGFCLFPVALTEMIALADQDRMLPPKSTWFEPRMKNGLIVYEF